MKVLVVNGSPRVEKSNTIQLTNAVVEGIKNVHLDADVDIFNVKNMDIKPCIGCMSCWGQTAGRCIINDVMQDVHTKIMEADIIILSFPLYFFGMPGSMKTFVDRLMPLMETYRGTVKDIGDNAFHEFRYDMGNKKFVVVSSCGYGRTNEIFDALIKEFNFIYGKDRYTALLCPQGEMFAIEPLKPQINEYLKRYVSIGECLGRMENPSAEMVAHASEPILPQRAFEMLVNNYWNSVTPKDVQDKKEN